jgi:hypothetical protein
MTTSISSVSPQRRIGNAASPFQQYANPHSYSYQPALPSPQSFGVADIAHKASLANGNASANANVNANANPIGVRGRSDSSYQGRNSISGGQVSGVILPTPDPTVGSVISDEDVALQLMRLGDASNFSTHGRTSTSTVDDALSGKADAASSDDETDDGSIDDDNDVDLRGVQFSRGNSVGTEDSGDYADHYGASFPTESGVLLPGDLSKAVKKARLGSKQGKTAKVRKWKVKMDDSPLSPAGSGQGGQDASRKLSNASLNFQHFQQPFAEDEEDLSSKPRCQRCRKSKKGCDRQRPCGRCRDAGIGADGCVSEDEGNGRKGRYGRHMGVPIKKISATPSIEDLDGVMPPFNINTSMAPPPLVGDKSKKRKR